METLKKLLLLVLLFAASAGLVLPTTADAGIKLRKNASRSSLNNFSGSSTDGGCSTTTGTPFPTGKHFAIQDIVCTVGEGLTPPLNVEKYWLSVVDGASCSGSTVLAISFTSDAPLHFSPNLPLGVSENMTVRLLRTSAENGALVQVSCRFYGTFEKAP